MVVAAFLAAPAVAYGQATDAPRDDRQSVRMAGFVGLQQWNDLDGLRPAAGGRFDSAGLNLGGEFHWRVGERGRRRLLAGIDFAFFSNESDIRHVRGDLTARGLYVAPSVKWLFDRGDGPRYAFDAGLGYYTVDLAEIQQFDFGGYFEDQLWEDAAFGGYVGVTVDFPRKVTGRRHGFSLSARAHAFDLGRVRDEGEAAVSFGTLGQDAGSLGGPVIMLNFGYHWF